MKYRLYDTSAWIDFRKNVASALTNQLDEDLLDNLVCICPVIIQEVLQGIREDADFEALKEDFKALKILQLEATEVAVAAAQLYRQLRKKGVTIRKPNDCLIAAYALHFDVELCHNDVDFDQIAAHTDLKIWKPAL
ncbi:PIN domain-containing protein [Runella sp. SP2]|uniref:type II toxin-antitoxin system VapC family toxin n=1 Tax=Runella sp. SP2 TaxID=2268026 RepID=UPI000F08C27C|nr:PIN domain-containing protein [Runella sp. SP2]AYQ32997.1 PIN domain nuclease [Runella sp. SP2]